MSQSRKDAPTSYPCPKCGSPMRPVMVEPDGPDHELRTFACAPCGERTVVRIAYR